LGLRQASERVRDRFVQQYRDEILIRRRGGDWVTADDILLPGALIEPEDTSPNQNILVDDTVHGGDSAVLRAIGCRTGVTEYLAVQVTRA
jgi:hypothetical protein